MGEWYGGTPHKGDARRQPGSPLFSPFPGTGKGDVAHLGSGVAWIDSTNTKVVEVVLDKTACGWDVEESRSQHPHLGLAQIHAALAYYYDHQDEVDAEIERRYREVQRMKAAAGDSPVKKRLRDAGLLP